LIFSLKQDQKIAASFHSTAPTGAALLREP
jgi:hypothetical protein